MKVIKRGTPDKEKAYLATCDKCDSQLEFKLSEIQVTSDRNEMVYIIDCPVCQNKIYRTKLTQRPPRNL